MVKELVGRYGKLAPSYKSLRSKAISDGELFQDPTFPADNTSLFLKPQDPSHPQNIVWKRPKELTKDPRLYIDGAVACDVCHDNVANAWFVAACTALASEKTLWAKVVPKHLDQEWNKNTAGIFRFCLWLSGAWVDIIIDDRLPTVDGKLLHSYSRSKNEFWGPLLEKAYAKYFGCYELLELGTLSDSLVDLTGGLSETTELWGYPKDGHEELYQRIKGALDAHSLLCCAISVEKLEEMGERTAQGLVKGHTYVIIGAAIIPTPNKLSLLRLRSPWSGPSWSGPYGRGSTEWSRLSSTDRDRLGLTCQEDAEFWIPFEDFVQSFTDLCICHVVRSGWFALGKVWNEASFQGEWTVGDKGTAKDRSGGCINNRDTFLQNPQYRFDIAEEDSTIMLYLQQCVTDSVAPTTPLLVIGFHVMQVEMNRAFRVHSIQRRACSSEYVRARGVFLRWTFKRGRYVIVPTTYDPGSSGKFILRVLTEKDADAKELQKDLPTAKMLPCNSAPCLVTVIKVVGAKGLEKQDSLGMADPYCVIICEGQSVRSSVCMETLDPVWNTTAIFYRKDVDAPIKIQIWNSNILMDSYMAKAHIQAPLMLEKQILEVELTGHKKRQSLTGEAPVLGTVCVELFTTDDMLSV
ncbi:calpain-5-like isoform X2 [Ornithodoros turicata]